MRASAMHGGTDKFTRASSCIWYPDTRRVRETDITWHKVNVVEVYMPYQHSLKPEVRVRVVKQTPIQYASE